ncbi:hypothetical protein CU098_006087 [Rhizopus stolonifer]|uniref:Alpha/beta hydrolase fold-3 domain-containing protein n=1 Tax=Rhizopus stolonifer TaxID=4846 RepID=A0A367JZU9_RHIST|nr:hypothetical protein CU098_006087 [Rhizopus stolonifer]
MNQIRVALNKLPPGPTINILRKVFSMPSPVARLILNDITKPRSSHKPWIHKVTGNNEWSGCWIGENIKHLDQASLMKRINESDIVFFNVHGGGFRIGSCTMYMDTWIQWIKVLKLHYGMQVMIMSIDYRLAPEYKYPSLVEDVVRAYEYLTRTLQVDANKIIVSGDSAGASLILEMLFITHDPSMFEIVTDDESGPTLTELPRPAAAVFSSPLVTDKTNSASWKHNVKYDYITQYTAKIIKKDYFEPVTDAEEDNPILGIAKLESGFHAFLPEQVLMFIGNKEVLRDDALELAQKAQSDGVYWETVVEDCVHDWFCVREIVKDKKMLLRADATFASFCYRAVRHGQGNTPTAIPYEDIMNASGYSIRRSNEGLDVVLEEEEDDDDTDLESVTVGVADLGKKKLASDNTIVVTEKVIKQKTETVFV